MGTEKFRGQTAVITGAASGIGRGLAQHAAKLGMNLVLADINTALLEEFADSLSGAPLAVPVDVTDGEQVEKLAKRAFDTFGHVDLVFNNAGILVTGFIWEIEPARFEQNMAVNVRGVLNGIRAFIPRMLAAGKSGCMVNTASIGGFLPSPLLAPYTASKFAVVGLTESLHHEMQMLKAPIQISLLCPGPVRSAIFSDPAGDQHPAVQQFVTSLVQMMDEHGISPEQLATRAFAGIAKGDYWLFPQPEYVDEALRTRLDTILQRRSPVSGL